MPDSQTRVDALGEGAVHGAEPVDQCAPHQAAKPLRKGTAEFNVVLVEG